MAAPFLYASEIITYGDAELDRYLEENGRVVRVHDPANLPESFLQRLRNRVGGAGDAAQSRSINLDRVSARLLEISRSRRNSEHSEDASSLASWSSEDQYQQDLALEREYHDKLVKDGAQPWYPVRFLENVSKNPKNYDGILGYWQKGIAEDPDEWRVFGRQFLRWSHFREWQAKRRRTFEGRVSEHTEWAKVLMAKYSFRRQFQFDQDPKRQDKLTTWIEYLAYEYNIYHGYMWYQRNELWYEKEWNKLASSGVLRPNETKENIWRSEFSVQLDREEDQAKRAVEAAQHIAGARPSTTKERKLSAAQSKLDQAMKMFRATQDRNNIISEFWQKTRKYHDNKLNAERHVLLLEWIRGQIPSIELELKQSNLAANQAESRSGDRGLGEAGPRDVEASGERVAGKKQGRQKEAASHSPTASNATGPQTRKRARDDDTSQDGVPSKRPRQDVGSEAVGKASFQATGLQSAKVSGPSQPRRSARIAAHQGRTGIASALPPNAGPPRRTAKPLAKVSRTVKRKPKR